MKGLIAILFLFAAGTISAQVKFDSNDPYWLNNYGLPEVIIYESYKDAIKDKTGAYKLNCINEQIGKNGPKLSKLMQLQLMNLENNMLTSIPSEWALLVNMYIMVSKKNPIQYIAPLFASESNLLYLELYDTKLDSLPKEIEFMSKLELLRIEGNTTDTLRISDSIKRIPSLREVIMVNCNLYNFPEFIFRSEDIESITLVNCKVDSIPLEIQWMKKLKVLNLEGNNIKEVPYWIKNCKSLEVLNLRNNKIDNFSEWTANMPSLQYLDIRDNQLSLPDTDILRVLFKNKQAQVFSDYERLLKERIGEQKVK